MSERFLRRNQLLEKKYRSFRVCMTSWFAWLNVSGRSGVLVVGCLFCLVILLSSRLSAAVSAITLAVLSPFTPASNENESTMFERQMQICDSVLHEIARQVRVVMLSGRVG